MRFDAPEYIHRWRESGAYPAIHAQVVRMCVESLEGVRGVDVCCSHGLLGAQLMANYGFNMIGIDGDSKAVALALDNRVPLPIHKMKVTQATIGQFFAHVVQHGAQFLVMRRCAPELFGGDLQFGEAFFKQAVESGINEVILEGRVKTASATNKLPSVEHEIDLAGEYYRVIQKVGQVAHLRKAGL